MSAAWPQLDFPQWQPTATTLHLWTQIVGKTRLALTPLQNHWWNVPLYVSARGLTTSAMPVSLPKSHDGKLEIEFDFIEHKLDFRLSSGAVASLPLIPQSVADFFSAYKRALAELDVEVKLNPMPVELQAPVRFDLDHENASYDPAAVERFHQVLIRADTLFKLFSTGFQGKISPVHFFWGSFDLCVTRFSGRLAAGPPRPDPMQQEAYSHEVVSAGFWPGNGGYGAPAFYCYAAPVPAGLSERLIHPGAWDPALGEFLLRYDDALASGNPSQAILDFLDTTYAGAADAAQWDRAALDRPRPRTDKPATPHHATI